MGQWEMLLEYFDSNLVLVFKTKPVKESKRTNEEVVDANENGLKFAPQCNSFCFTKKKEYDHEKKNVQINNVDKYVRFPSKWYHQGYFNDVLGKVVVQVQLFARPSIAPDGALSTRAPFKVQIIKGQLALETVTPLCNDMLVNWDRTYSRDHFETCKDFYGPVDKECNHQIPTTKFNQIPLIRNLVDTFCVMFPYLPVDMVWLIVKSKPGSGFQSWHRDFYLDEKIIKTIVVNLGSMKRSEVPGAAFGKLCKSPPEINNEIMKGEGKSVMKKLTKVNLGTTKRSDIPGVAFGKLRKSPPEINNETMKGRGKSVKKKPTKVNLGSTKRSEVPGVVYGNLRKSPPEVKDDTMKGEGKIVMKTLTKDTDETMKVEGDETIRSAKQDDNYGASNIVLPCPGS
jgi:hypothetical protein